MPVRVPILRGVIPRVASRPLLPLTRLTSASNRALTPRPRAGLQSFRSFYASPRHLTSPPPTPSSPSSEPQTLTQRLKILIKSYGWYALGVYLVIGAVDFSVAFLGIQLLGADLVTYYTAQAKAFVFDLINYAPAQSPDEKTQSTPAGGSEGLYAMILLAWTVHKTLFLPLRVGITAAVTPKFVGWLTKRGWVGTSGARRAATEMRERVRKRSRESNNI